MALTGYDKAAVSGAIYPFRVKVEIQADDESWCDINKLEPSTSADAYYRKLKKLPTLKSGTEREPGRFTVSADDIELDDSDSAFAGDGWTLYDADGVDHTLTAWYHALVKVSIGHHVDSETAWDYTALPILRIENVRRRAVDKTAIMTVTGREKQFIEKMASALRRGDAPPVNMPLKRAVEELVEIGGEGAVSMESGSPPDDMTVESSTALLSLIGNIPGTDTSGNWNEDTDFVSKYRASSGDKLWHFGYSKKNNDPACCYWDRSANTWSDVFVYDLSDGVSDTGAVGYQIVFVAQGRSDYDEDETVEDYWVACVVGNVSYEDQTLTHGFGDDGNLRLYFLIIPFGIDDSSDISIKLNWGGLGTEDYGPVWPCNHVAQRPIREDVPDPYGYRDFYGRFEHTEEPGASTPHNVPVFFPSTCHSPGFDEGGNYDPTVWTAEGANSTTGAVEPYRMQDLLTIPGDFRELSVNWTTPLNPGYYSYKRIPAGVNDDHPPLYWRTHGDLHEAFKYAPSKRKIYWVVWDGYADEEDGLWRLLSFNVDSLTATSASLQFSGTEDHAFYRHQITSFAVTNDDVYDRLYVGCVNTYDLSTSGEHPGPQLRYGNHYDSSPIILASGMERHFSPRSLSRSEKDHRYGPIFISIRIKEEPQASHDLFGAVVDWFSSGSQCYGLWFHNDIGEGANGVFQRHSAGASNDLPLPLSAAPLTISNMTSGEEYYIQDCGNGSLWLGRASTGFRLISEGEPVDGENTWNSGNLFVDSPGGYTDRLYGVSASGPPADTQLRVRYAYGSTENDKQWGSGEPNLGGVAPGGRMSMWDYSADMHAVLRVADFGPEANTWNALEQCRLFAGDYVMGFNGDGAFYFKPRTTADATITIKGGDDFGNTDATEIFSGDLQSDYDHKSVYNSFTIPVYEGERAPPEAELVLTADSKADAFAVTSQQTGHSAQRLVLRCINAASLDSSSGDTPLLFSWRRVHADLKATLMAAVAITATSITVYGLYTAADSTYRLGDVEIEAGDEVRIGDSNWTAIDSITPSSGTLGLAEAIGGSGAYPKGSSVTIRREDKSRFSDSMDGVCTLQSVFEIEARPNDTRPAATTMVVDSVERLKPGMVLCYGSAMIEYLEDTGNKDAGNPIIRVKPGACGSGSCNATEDQQSHIPEIPSGAVLRGAIWVQGNGKTYSISNSGVSFSVTAPSADIYRNSRFAVGDRIVITCEGLKNRKVPHAIYTNTHAASVARYGQKDYKFAVENFLMTPARAKILLAQTNNLVWPSYLTRAAKCPMLITQASIGPCAAIDVYSEYLYPNETDYTMPHHVVGWKLMLERGEMLLHLRSRSRDLTEVPAAVAPRPAWVLHGWATGRPGG